MKSTNCHMTIAAVLAAFSMSAAAGSYSDDFEGASIDSEKWELFAVAGCDMILNSGSLNYVRTGTPTADDFAALDFADEPGYDSHWEVIVDVTNSVLRTDANTQFTGAGISIGNFGPEFEFNEIFLELGNEFSPDLKFFGNFITDGDDSPGNDDILDAGGTGGSLRISYNGSAKVFSIWVDPSGSGDGYQWQLLSSYGIAGTGGIRNTDWQMSSEGTFIIALYGLSANLAVNNGGVTFDNFRYNEFGSPPPVAPVEQIAPQIALVGVNVQLTIDPTVPGRRYQAQKSASLAIDDWENVGDEQTGGAGWPLIITLQRDPLATSCFYRILLDPVPTLPK